MKVLWTQEEINRLYELYPNSKSFNLECLFPGRKRAAIQQKANKLNIHRKDERKLYKLLDGSLESCYWIGFILADGWLTEKFTDRKLSTFGITLSDKDKEHVIHLGKYLNVPVNVYSRTTKFSKSFNYYNITVNDNVNVPLIRTTFCIQNNKTTNPPKMSAYDLTDSQMMALISGYIDGDGSIAIRSNNRKIISIQCSHTWNDNLMFIIDTLSNFFKVNTKNKVSINRRGHASIYIGNQTIVNGIRQFGLDNSLPLLKRKWSLIP